MSLSKIQFDLLSKYIDGFEVRGYTSEQISETEKELISYGYVKDCNITEKGLEALEPYKVRRAIFLAAGFGSRLVPITLNTPKPLIRVHSERIIDHAIDACLEAGIEEIYIVRGYLKEQFDQLLYKYPMIKFIDNDEYNTANNISSAIRVKDLFCNTYVLDADNIVFNHKVIRRYQYSTNFMGVKVTETDDWFFKTENNVITDELKGGSGDDIYLVIGISYWDEKAGRQLEIDLQTEYDRDRNLYWEFVPILSKKDNYTIMIRECDREDVIEIDTYDELKAIDEAYRV
ncbi:MAG: phosphocholine cytidylyltransferase family protein [Erysipelotrichaceae bacterium]|nr:phosphocholine cytidylyltransferase family protein [Erysipelotrichaceae bacterium]